MASIKGYADDSRPNDRIWVVGGYAGHDLQWEQFEHDWPEMLEKHGVPYFHMREMGKPNGVYAKWHPFKEHQTEVAAFFADLTKVITDCWLRPYFAITRVKDLERFNAEHGLNLEPYSLAAYGCMLMIAKDHLRGATAEIVFDHVEKVTSRLARAFEYAETDSHYSEVHKMVVPLPLNKSLTFKDVIPLQAADFLIWEMQKHHLGRLEEWFLIPDKPTDPDARDAHMDQWSLEKFGVVRPPARKSLDVIVDNGAPPGAIVWDYDNIVSAHRLRCGRWS
jgi:hypothetical protein